MIDVILRKGITLSFILVMLWAMPAQCSPSSFDELIEDSASYEFSPAETDYIGDISVTAPPKEKSIIPEPGTIALIGAGVFAVLRRRKRLRG